MKKKKYSKEEIYTILFEGISRVGEVDPEILTAILETTEPFMIRKKELVLKEGEICKYCYFIVDGMLRAYSQNGDNEATLWIMVTGDISIGVTSFYDQTPSEEYIVAVEDTICVRLHYDDLEMIYEKYVKFNIIGRKLTEKYHKLFYKQMCNIVHPPDVRYEKLLAVYPYMANKVLYKYIAPMLGITPSHFSKIRREMAKKSII